MEILSILTFSVGSILIASLALRGYGSVIPEIAAAVPTWIVIFFTNLLIFTTAFTREADRGAIGGLKTLPCSPIAVLAGKIVYGTALIFLAICVLVPCSPAVFKFQMGGNFLILIFICFLGATGFSFLGSFVSGLVMFLREKPCSFPFLLIPVCMPVILLSVTQRGK